MEITAGQGLEIIYCEKNNCNKFIEIIYFWPSEITIIYFLKKIILPIIVNNFL